MQGHSPFQMLAAARRLVLLAGLLLLPALAARAQVCTSFDDLLPPGTAPINPQDMTRIGNNFVFRAADALHGTELWTSDGTAYNTRLLMDINPGPGSSNPRGFTVYGSRVYFCANGPDGAELYASDGTESDTGEFLDINPSGDATPSDFVSNFGFLLFAADDGVHGRELWRSDGTVGNTHLAADIVTGAGGSNPCLLTAFGTKVVFNATTPSAGAEPWYYDIFGGSAILVRDIYPGTEGSKPTQFTLYNSRIYFAADDSIRGQQLYAWNGTFGGIYRVSTITFPGDFSLPQQLHAGGGFLLSAARGNLGLGSTGVELWVHYSFISNNDDGGDLALLDELVPGTGSANPSSFTTFGGKVYFAATDSTGATNLWRTDGNVGGAELVYGFDQSTGYAGDPRFLTIFQGKLLFTAETPENGVELWNTDGTNTALLADCVPGGPELTAAQELFPLNSHLFFRAHGGQPGGTLWKFTLGNPPSATGLTLTPPVPSAGAAITVSYTYADPDNDPEGATQIRWLRNGAVLTAYNNQDTLPGSQIQSGDTIQVSVAPVDSTGEEGPAANSELFTIVVGFQTADRDQNNIISLSELLRVIQFYNSLGYACADNPGDTEDGFVPGPGANHSCSPYGTDYNPQDWAIGLTELLRVIQFYNSGGYHYCPADATEDGFCPGLT